MEFILFVIDAFSVSLVVGDWCLSESGDSEQLNMAFSYPWGNRHRQQSVLELVKWRL
jgi:hypothetical protein